jgi:cytochrome subunit of sulfide dehydrogenase
MSAQRIADFSGLAIRDPIYIRVFYASAPRGWRDEPGMDRRATLRAAFMDGAGGYVPRQASDDHRSVHLWLGHDCRRRRSAGFFVSAPSALVALAMSAGLLLGSADRSGAGDRGAQIAAVCASCHRLDGRDHGIPSIIGLDEATLVAEMRAFKAGERPGQIMRVMSLSLTAEDFAAVARYLAAQRKDTNPR